MRKKVLFIYRYEALNNIVADNGKINGPDEFFWGINHLDQKAFDVKWVNTSRNEKRIGIRRLSWLLEFPFAKLTRIGLPIELYYKFKEQIKWADYIVCVNDQISLGILFWRLFGCIKDKKIFCIIMSLQERIKYFKWNCLLVYFVGKLLQQADIIFTLSKIVIKDFVKNYRLDNEKIRTLYFGPDTVFWHELNLERSNFILSVGNDMNRDFQTLINAIPDDMSLKLVTKKGVNAKGKDVEQLYGVSNKALLELYNRALFIVVPSIKLKNESSGLSCIMQAMACGTPVISSDCPTLRELFTDNEHCLFYEPENMDSLVEKINLLKRDKSLRDKLALKARELVNKRYTSQKIGEQIGTVMVS